MKFRTGHTAFEGLSFELNDGDKVAILGENGAGKTTLLRVLATLLAPSSGDLEIFGFSAKRQSKFIRPLIGWAPAYDQSFFSRLTGIENLIYFGSSKKMNRNEISKHADFWSEILPLRQALSTPYCLCSTGMKQGLSLTRALLGDPDLLLLDEPSRSLTPDVFKNFMQALGSTTLIFSAHTKDQVQSWTDRTIYLSIAKPIQSELAQNV